MHHHGGFQCAAGLLAAEVAHPVGLLMKAQLWEFSKLELLGPELPTMPSQGLGGLGFDRVLENLGVPA